MEPKKVNFRTIFGAFLGPQVDSKIGWLEMGPRRDPKRIHIHITCILKFTYKSCHFFKKCSFRMVKPQFLSNNGFNLYIF